MDFTRVIGVSLCATLGFFQWSCGDSTSEEPSVVLEGVPGDDGIDTLEFATITATIGPEGGVLQDDTAFGMEGFSLKIPAGALTEATEISVRPTLDPIPLPDIGAPVGSQFEIMPAGLVFAVDAEVTLPISPELRRRWNVEDAECRAWARDGDGWKGVDNIAYTETSVTVPVSGATTIGAGVFVTSFAVFCTNCMPAKTPAIACVDGTKFCLEKIGTQQNRNFIQVTSYAQSTLFWVAPAGPAGMVVIASFDVLNRRALPDSGQIPYGSGRPLGDVTIDRNGDRWWALPSVGNIRFTGTSVHTRFDMSSTINPAGVVLDTVTGEAMRMRAKPVSTTVSEISGVEAGVIYPFGKVDLGQDIGVSALDRGTRKDPIVAAAFSLKRGTSALRNTTSASLLDRTNKCGDATLALQTAWAPFPRNSSPRTSSFATVCMGTTNGATATNAAVTKYRQNLLSPFNLIAEATTEIPIDLAVGATIAVDGRGTIWLAAVGRAQITRIGADGGITDYPLSDAARNTAEYSAMVPTGLHYEPALDTLIMVAQGGDIYEITNLP